MYWHAIQFSEPQREWKLAKRSSPFIYAIEEGIVLGPIYWPQSSGHDVSESGSILITVLPKPNQTCLSLPAGLFLSNVKNTFF